MNPASLTGLNPCVHCGFCLQSCPTYVATGDEADGPRGRIVLMQQLGRGELSADDDALALHLDRCLGCRGCESACPSGVEYGAALEDVRASLAATRPVSPVARLVLAVFAEGRARRPLLALGRWARPFAGRVAGSSRVGFTLGMLAATKPPRHWANGRAVQRDPGPAHREPPRARGPAAPFRGCVMEGLFGHVHQATARTLHANGFTIHEVPGQGCCGALHAHAGLHRDAQALARHNVTAFARYPDSTVVVNSAGCGAMLKAYGRLLRGEPQETDAVAFAARVKDVTEVLAAAGPRPGAPLELRVAYDSPCHLQHAQRISREPLAVLDAIPGLDLAVHPDADHCCGSAGIYSLVQRQMSQAVLGRKLAALLQAAPDAVVTGNPGCVMQIGAGLRAQGRPIPVLHPVELLDGAYAAAGFYEETGASLPAAS